VAGTLLGPFEGLLMEFTALRWWPLTRNNIVRTTQPLSVLPMAILVLGRALQPRSNPFHLTNAIVISDSES
jgi:hypothetical protein